MPKLSQRISALNTDGSDGWEVFYRARALKAQGHDITELTIGEHDITTAPDILDAMHRAAKAGHTGYAIVSGIDPLRSEIARRVSARTGVATRLENVLITPGGQSALFAAHMAALSPGDTALFVDPYYATYPGTIRAASGRPHAITTRAQQAFLPTYEQIMAQPENARSLLINSPNNPTGTVYPPETLQDIARACQERDLWLVSDEVYDTQVWEGHHVSPRALPDMADRTMVIGSMSKSHAMTGSRIGWIIAPVPVIDRLIDLATTTTYGVPGYIQDAALFALQQGEETEHAVAAPFKRRRDLAMDLFNQQTIIKVTPSRGAMYLMLDIRATGLSGKDFANQLLDAHGIATMPGESFGQAASGHLRIALTVADEVLIRALRTLCDFAAGLAKTQTKDNSKDKT